MTITICPNCDNGDPTSMASAPIVKRIETRFKQGLPPLSYFHCHECGHESNPDDERWVWTYEERG